MAYAVAQVFGSCVCVLFSFWLENNASAWMSGCPCGRVIFQDGLHWCPNSIWHRYIYYRIGHVTGGPRINYLASVAQIELCNLESTEHYWRKCVSALQKPSKH